MRGVLYRRLIHLSLLVTRIHLADRNGSTLPYRLAWQVRRATSLDCLVCAWVCCNPRIAHRDRRSLLFLGFLCSLGGSLECSGARAAFFALACHAFLAAGFDPIALGVDVGVKAGLLRHVGSAIALSLPAHNGCGVALGSARSHHHGLALPWHPLGRTY